MHAQLNKKLQKIGDLLAQRLLTLLVTVSSFKFQKCFIEHCIYNISIKSIYLKSKFNG